MKTRLLQLLLASAFLFSHSKTAMGQNSVWMMHSGITNPTNESFRLFQGEGATVGPVFSDFGIDTWATHQTEGGIFAVVYYQQLMTPQQHLEINCW